MVNSKWVNKYTFFNIDNRRAECEKTKDQRERAVKELEEKREREHKRILKEAEQHRQEKLEEKMRMDREREEESQSLLAIAKKEAKDNEEPGYYRQRENALKYYKQQSFKQLCYECCIQNCRYK